MPSAEFNKFADSVANLKSTPTNEELLKLYGLFKHSNFGDNNTPKPNSFLLKACAKWETWLEHKGKTVIETEKLYIELCEKVIEKYGFN